MNLQFSRKELSAIINVSTVIIMADGKVDERENLSFTMEMLHLGIGEELFASLLNDAKMMGPAETFSIIGSLGDDKKKYVAALLGTLIASDGNIDNKEMEKWRAISIICNLPQMEVTQALKIINEF